MRYAIGCTIVNKKSKLASPPYLICLNVDDDLVCTVDSFKHLQNKNIIVCHSVDEGEDMIQFLKKRIMTKDSIHLYLLKIDSLNFSYKITNNFQIRRLKNNQIVHFERVKELK